MYIIKNKQTNSFHSRASIQQYQKKQNFGTSVKNFCALHNTHHVVVLYTAWYIICTSIYTFLQHIFMNRRREEKLRRESFGEKMCCQFVEHFVSIV